MRLNLCATAVLLVGSCFYHDVAYAKPKTKTSQVVKELKKQKSINKVQQVKINSLLGLTNAIVSALGGALYSSSGSILISTPQGAQGPQGVAGPQGATGAQGPQGIAGVSGAQGVQGVAGPKGDKGDRGEQGVAGLTGSQGPAGPMGPIGPVGETGPQGPSGEMPAIAFTVQPTECVTVDLRETCGGLFGCRTTFTRMMSPGTSTYGYSAELRFQNVDVQGGQGGTRFVSIYSDYDHGVWATVGAGTPGAALWYPYNDFILQNNPAYCPSDYQSPPRDGAGTYMDPYTFTLRGVAGRTVALKFIKN